MGQAPLPGRGGEAAAAVPGDPQRPQRTRHDALGDRLWGVRLDTSGTMVDRSLWHAMGGFRPVGVAPELLREVRRTLDRDVATIALAAAHAPVRDALQASLPRLVEALAGSGLQLGQASVGAESFLGGHAQDRGAGRGSQESSPSLLSPATTEIPSRAMRMQPLASAMARGGIDLFA